MASLVGEASVCGHTGEEMPVAGRRPMTTPPSSETVNPDGTENAETKSRSEDQNIEQKDVNNISWPEGEDHKTKSEQPQPVQVKLSEPVQTKPQLASQRNEEATVLPAESGDYFAAKIPHASNVTDFAQKTSASTIPTSGRDGRPPSRHGDALIYDHQRNPETSWKDFSTQTVIGPTFIPGSTRPTSVPNFQSTHRRREGPEYPTYPDQSFAALQSQVYPPPYSPGLPPSLRTRSSHPSQNFSASSTDVYAVREFPQTSSGAKTVGSTPAQSPGLFSPMFPTRRQWAGGSDDGRAGTPMLHPSHHKAPKE